MNEFKSKKLAEWEKLCKSIILLPGGEECYNGSANDYTLYDSRQHADTIKQFISDLIDEMKSNLFLKYIVTKTRIDTLKKIVENLPNKSPDRGYNDCLWEIIKDLEMELEDLTNLNKE